MRFDVTLRSLISGLASFIPGLYAWWDRRRAIGNTQSVDYCESIWKRHGENYTKATGINIPNAIAELGPGATLGVCMTALLQGVNQAHALDAGYYVLPDAN